MTVLQEIWRYLGVVTHLCQPLHRPQQHHCILDTTPVLLKSDGIAKPGRREISASEGKPINNAVRCPHYKSAALPETPNSTPPRKPHNSAIVVATWRRAWERVHRQSSAYIPFSQTVGHYPTRFPVGACHCFLQPEAGNRRHTGTMTSVDRCRRAYRDVGEQESGQPTSEVRAQ